MPNLFEEDAIFIPLRQNFDNNIQEVPDFTRSKLNKYIDVRNKIQLQIKSETFKKNIKVFSLQKGLLNVRPNYIDNILNSI